MKEYIIKITGEYDILVLSPEMIALLMDKMRQSDTKELVIPAEEILPQGYVQYLMRVLQANSHLFRTNGVYEDPYQLISNQISRLNVNGDKCFEHVSVSSEANSKNFDLNATKEFYLLTKQNHNDFAYVYKDTNGNEIKVSLTYQ